VGILAFFGFTILKSEISFDVKSVLWQCVYRQCVVGLCSLNSGHGIGYYRQIISAPRS